MNDSIKKIYSKYPHLFSDDALSISDCPEGWEKIVINFCESLDSYKKSYRSKSKKCLRNYLLNFIAAIIKKVQNFISPYKNGKIIFSMFKQKKTRKEKIYDALGRIWSKVVARKTWLKVFPPDIKIEQIKEKFGTLRIYLNYSDERVYGMVDLAECLSSTTCELTGKDGQLCWRGKWRWYKTLSLDKARELEYTPADETDRKS